MGDPIVVYVEREVDGITIDYVRNATTDTWYDLEDVEQLQPGTLRIMEIVG